MTEPYDPKRIIHDCIQHTIRNSLTHKKPSVSYAYSRVVAFKSISEFLEASFALESFTLHTEYPTFHDFFLVHRTKITPEQIEADFDGWYFDVMNLYEYNSSFRAFQPIWPGALKQAGVNDLEKDFLFVIYQVNDAVTLRDFEREALFASKNVPLLKGPHSEKEKKDVKKKDQQVDPKPATEVKTTKITIEEYQYDSYDSDDEVVKDKVVVEVVETKKQAAASEQPAPLEQRKEEEPKTVNEPSKVQEQSKDDTIDDDYCLDQEIIDFTQKYSMSKQSFLARASIVDRLNHMLNSLWGQKGVYVSTFGSSLSGLGGDDAKVDLCIVIPYNSDHTRYEIKLLRLLPNSMFNMYCVANYLTALGMINVKPINTATVPICTFVDPITTLKCNVNTNDVLGIHTTKLIMQYMKLDVRIRPLLFTIRYLCKKKSIASARNGTMSSYAYHLLALYYLIHVQDPPVLPNLQQLTGAECKSKRCSYKRSKQMVDGCDVRYHDCVIIDNKETEDFAITFDLDEQSTLWSSTSTKEVGELLIEFLEYFSNQENLFKTMSISTPVDKIEMQKYWEKHLIVLQDPFSKTRNVCSNVTKMGGDLIRKEFKKASEMLKNGKTLQEVIEHKDDVPRPVDPECLAFRLGRQQRQTYVLTN
ncbi:hypothetical protein BD560DRAFT_418079 [Blakeslea trispora]|nr:hypothetical protein BD560DRAFT_418079 [Blakeslea trispora]